MLQQIGTGNLPNIEELDVLFTSNCKGLAFRLVSLDIAKKYPIKMAEVRNTIDTFTRSSEHLLFIASPFLV